jgi:serine/threonine-protein kinase
MLDREFIDLQHALAGEYSLERELGRGGMGIVYLAREVQLDRLVAIKVLPEALAAQPEVRERFLREARMAASLSHPHIVPIYRVGEAGGFVFFVMAYVNGETLGDRLRSRGPLNHTTATRLLREVAWALSYAHGRGIVHRDVKPDNILIEAETGRALVSDFGIARGAEETAISDPGRVMGTAHFMSPEQASNQTLDGRSDLYSLGVVAYLALSGKLPFNGTSVPVLMTQHVNVAPPGLASAAPSTPRALTAVVDRLLRKNPAERFATGEELAEAIEGASAPTRAKLPIALRVWTQSQNPMRGLYFAWSGLFTMAFLAQMVVLFGLKGGGKLIDLVSLAALGSAPLVPLTIFHLRKTYQALAAGYSLRDLRAALATWRQEKRDEIEFEFDEKEAIWARVLRALPYALCAGLGSTFFIGLPNTKATGVLRASLIVSTVVSISASSALGVRFVPKGIRSKLIGAARSAFWNSRIGEWTAKLLTPKHRKAVADLDYRPTEMALGVAVEELYAALPKAYREHVPDLPTVVQRLEAHAAAARARVDELNALASLGGADVAQPTGGETAARDAAKKELADSVAALEAVRLDLLRLHGGATDLRSITTILDAARELGEELDRLGRAQREVNDVVLPLDLRPQTPA